MSSRTSTPSATTHATVDSVVVFHIGMTIRRHHRPDLWLPVATAMPRMLTELGRAQAAHDRGDTPDAPDLGFLGAHTLVGRTGPWVVQYWRSVEHLHAYARMETAAHLPAWKAYNSAARRRPGAVGIWHETYIVPAYGIETIYRTDVSLGLARAVGSRPLASRGRTARERLDSA